MIDWSQYIKAPPGGVISTNGQSQHQGAICRGGKVHRLVVSGWQEGVGRADNFSLLFVGLSCSS